MPREIRVFQKDRFLYTVDRKLAEQRVKSGAFEWVQGCGAIRMVTSRQKDVRPYALSGAGPELTTRFAVASADGTSDDLASAAVAAWAPTFAQAAGGR